MNIQKIRPHLTLTSKFILAIIFILVVMGSSILFVIEQREVKAIMEEQISKGKLHAQYIIQLNLYDVLWWDDDTLKTNIEAQIERDDSLIYIVFFNRDGKTFTANDYILDHTDIVSTSNLTPELENQESSFIQKKIKGSKPGQIHHILEIESPIFVERSPKRWGSVKIGVSINEMYDEIKQTRMKLLMIGLGAIFIGIIGAIFLASRIVGPLKKLVEGTIRISKGDFSHKIDIHSQDEIGNLAKSFNDMSVQLLITKKRMELANRKLVQAEKLASIGRISATIAHEIRNPLTSVKLNIQKLSESNKMDKIEKGHLSISQEGIAQIESFIKEMLNFTRFSELNINIFSMEQIVDSSIKMIADSLDLKEIVLEKEIPKNLPTIAVDGDRMRQVFLNILRNACEAVERRGKIKIAISRTGETSNKKMRIEISDNGNGIPTKNIEYIFEPFYTTKSQGFGLGLANARKIIEQHHGNIKVKEKQVNGSCFIITIPYRGEK